MALSIRTQPVNANRGYILGGNNIRFTVATNLLLDVDNNVKPQFRIYAILQRINPNGTYTVIARVFGVPSPTDTEVISSATYCRAHFNFKNYIYADLQKFADAFISSGIPESHRYQYIVNFYEYDLGEQLPGVAQSLVFFAVPGGSPVMRAYNSTFANVYINPTPRSFLSLRNTIYFNPSNPIWLYFKPDAGINYVNAYAEYKNEIGDIVTATRTIGNFTGVASPFNIRAFKLDLNTIDWDDFVGEPDPVWANFKVLQVYISNSSNILIVNAINLVLQSGTMQSRTFYYRNSLGAIAVLHCTGKQVTKHKLTQSTAEVEPNNTTTNATKIVKGSILQFNQDVESEFEQNTGHQTEPEFNNFIDFIRSNERYELVNGFYYPIILTATDFNGNSDELTLFNRTFSYKYAHNEEFYA